jgi:hypothetical protein
VYLSLLSLLFFRRSFSLLFLHSRQLFLQLLHGRRRPLLLLSPALLSPALLSRSPTSSLQSGPSNFFLLLGLLGRFRSILCLCSPGLLQRGLGLGLFAGANDGFTFLGVGDLLLLLPAPA